MNIYRIYIYIPPHPSQHPLGNPFVFAEASVNRIREIQDKLKNKQAAPRARDDEGMPLWMVFSKVGGPL